MNDDLEKLLEQQMLDAIKDLYKLYKEGNAKIVDIQKNILSNETITLRLEKIVERRVAFCQNMMKEMIPTKLKSIEDLKCNLLHGYAELLSVIQYFRLQITQMETDTIDIEGVNGLKAQIQNLHDQFMYYLREIERDSIDSQIREIQNAFGDSLPILHIFELKLLSNANQIKVVLDYTVQLSDLLKRLLQIKEFINKDPVQAIINDLREEDPDN